VGKGTVGRRLRELNPALAYSVSVTTRAARPGEVDGRDYRFVPPRRFDELIEEDAFLEWAELFGHHRSGTLWGPVIEDLERGKDVVLEIDVQGAARVRERVPEAVLIFLMPPSLEELRQRLEGRGTEDPDALVRRLETAADEIGEGHWFDHIVVNDSVERAAAEVAAIIQGTQ
jgi:guanylate kinase